MRRINRLKDTDCRALRLKPGKRATRVCDGDGLYLEVRDRGDGVSKLWLFRYAFLGGKLRSMGLGRYPEVSLQEARTRRAEARALLGRRPPVDPIEERRRLEEEWRSEARRQEAERDANRTRARTPAAPTVQAVCEEWIERRAKARSWSARTRAFAEGAFARHIYPPFGDRPIDGVSAAELTEHLASIDRPETVRRLRQRLERVWDLAIRTGRAASNPAATIGEDLPTPEIQHLAAIREGDIPRLLDAIDEDGNVYVRGAVYLQLLTATRPTETRAAMWEEFDLPSGIWTIPAERMKRRGRATRRPHRVPLSGQARAIVEWLRQYAQGDYLFPHRSEPGAPMSNNTVSRAIKRAGFDVTAHGFRAVFSTVANEAGQNHDVIEACLAHAQSNQVRAAYNRAGYEEARRSLLQWWADHIDTLRSGTASRYASADAAGRPPVNLGHI
ncbi:tyrosine-type recombinase/integrase [Luteitalea sp.]